MRKFIFPFSFLIFLFTSIDVWSNVRLPSVIGSNMVLQQNAAATFWGWSDPGEKIFITTSWNNRTDSAEAKGEARWKISMPTPAAGGPFTITIKGYNTIVLENVMIGEVWLCSGQSNMEWSSYNKVKQILDELPNSHNENLRLFHITKTTSEYPQDNITGNWKVCSPESLTGFSAVGYFFGKKLQQELNVPIGLINASWGGTAAETWTPAEIVLGHPSLKEASDALNPGKRWPVKPGLAYNAMIAPIVSFNIAGVIWYQGENNTGTSATYEQLFTSMIGAWRKAWNKEFPFYYVQIAPYAYGNHNIAALLREQQTRAMKYPRTGMVVISDLVDNVNDIHPQNKKDVGHRLAAWALNDTYGKNAGPYRSPLFSRMETSKDKIILYFDHAPNGFVAKGTPTGFRIAGEDKQFLPADVKIDKQRIIVSNKQIKDPKAVRFSFDNTTMSNLFSKEGLPVTPFRTDDWDVDTSPVKK